VKKLVPFLERRSPAVKKHLMNLVLAVGLMGAMAIPTLAQAPGGAAGGNGAAGNNGGGRNRWDPQARMKQMMDQMKTDMGATDDEWKVLQPKIEAVQNLQREAMAARYAGMNRRRGNNNNNNNGDQAAPAVSDTAAALTKAAADLRTVLANKDSTPDQIKTALQALRDARAKSQAELKKAQDDLKSVASVRQEAVLVDHGILD
jgi:hypothetical protein